VIPDRLDSVLRNGGWKERMNLYLEGTLWIASAMVVGGLIAYLVRRHGVHEGRTDHNEAVGQVFTIVSGLHAVVLAFVLVTLFDTVGDVKDGAYKEAESVVNAYWAADALQAPAGDQARGIGAQYASTVLNEEWPKMRAGEPVTSQGWRQLERMRVVLQNAGAEGDWQDDRKTEALNQLSEVMHQRQDRLNKAYDHGVVAVVWVVLGLGTVVTVLLPALFGGTRMFAHVGIVSIVAGALVLLLFAIFELQNPYSGGAGVAPEAFQWALARLGPASP
jgi:hypothetical protein